MFFTIYFVEHPNVEYAIKLDDEFWNINKVAINQRMENLKAPTICETEVRHMDIIVHYLKFMHAYCFLAAFYREVYDSKLQLKGLMMRFFETLGAIMYLLSMAYCLSSFIFFYYELTPNEMISHMNLKTL